MRSSLLLRVALATTFGFALASCGLFKSTCEEDDRSCIGPGPGLGVGLGKACEISADCKEGLTCTRGVCAATGDTERCEDPEDPDSCTRCRITAECGDADYCGSQRICLLAGSFGVGDSCEDTGDCQHGLVCEAPELNQSEVVSLNELASLTGECREGGMKEQGEDCTKISECLAGLYCLQIDIETARKVCTNLPVPLEFEPPSLPELWDGVSCPPVAEDAPNTAVFTVPREDVDVGDDFYSLPFPNDIRRKNGRIDMSGHPVPDDDLGAPFVQRYIEVAQEDLEGFSTNPVAVFRFSHPYDFGTVRGDDANTPANEATVMFVDITPGSPEYNLNRGVEWKTTKGKLSRYVCPQWLGLRRPLGGPLRANTTYAAIVTTGVKAEGGDSFVRDADLSALLSANAPSGDAELEAAWDAYEPLRDWVNDTSQNDDTFLNVAVFTTQDPERVMRGVREVVSNEPAPTVSELTECESAATVSPCLTMETVEGMETPIPRGACSTNNDFTVIHGLISLPNFQQGTAPYKEPADGGAFELDENGVPKVQNRVDVCMSISVPNAPAPADGYPVLLVGHGTGGSFTGTLTPGGFAEAMAKASSPAVVISFDMPSHGSRRGESTDAPDELFYNFLNARAARDNVRQGAADMMSVVKWIGEGGLSASDSPTGSAVPLDASHVAILGHSQGATHASVMMSYEPGVQAVVLSGVGGHLTSSLVNKTSPVDIASVLPLGLMDPDSNYKLAADTFNPALAIIQSVFDPVDSINYARRLRREPTTVVPDSQHVFMSYGLDDTFSPEKTQLAYALAAGMTIVNAPVLRQPTEVLAGSQLSSVAPPLSGNEDFNGTLRTIGMRQYIAQGERAGLPTDGHFVTVDSQEPGFDDVVLFLSQTLAGDTPEIADAP